MIIETCCSDIASLRSALGRGSSRIELCEDLSAGGVTPSADLILEAVRIAGDIPVNVLVRPRGGNFVYSETEIGKMLSSISFCKSAGVSGIVTGALLPSGKVDLEATGRLIAAARPLTVTFHRAIDDSAEVFDSLEDIISLGADRVLSSGGCATALEGAAVLKEMVKRAAGRIIVMPGCGITPDNLSQVAAITGALEFHGTRI